MLWSRFVPSAWYFTYSNCAEYSQGLLSAAVLALPTCTECRLGTQAACILGWGNLLSINCLIRRYWTWNAAHSHLNRDQEERISKVPENVIHLQNQCLKHLNTQITYVYRPHESNMTFPIPTTYRPVMSIIRSLFVFCKSAPTAQYQCSLFRPLH